MYWNQRATVRVEGKESNNVVIKKEVRQGYVLSPALSNLHSKAVITKALTDLDSGTKVNEHQ